MKSMLFALFCALSVNAQTIKSEGTHFLDGIKDKKWNNSNGKDFTKASFADFSGACYVTLEIDETAEVNFKSVSTISKGKLEVKLIDEQEYDYFYCKTSKDCIVVKDITLEKGKKYRLYFIGENAKGNFEVNWEINK